MMTDIEKLDELYEVGKGIIYELDASVESFASEYSNLEKELDKEKKAHEKLLSDLNKLISRK